MPSGEVITVPLKPTATSWVPVHVTERSIWFLPELLGVHVMPSGEVAMESPTATSWIPVQITVLKDAIVPEFLVVQVMPSGEV